MKMMNIILIGFFLLETLENLYTAYVEYFLKQMSASVTPVGNVH
ncbi:PF07599 family protein [Leptospira interrogans serovar Bataviae str. L1111]|nr:PF07599 family protein [Leptospira interrogans serovar Bataviae str. L1111]